MIKAIHQAVLVRDDTMEEMGRGKGDTDNRAIVGSLTDAICAAAEEPGVTIQDALRMVAEDLDNGEFMIFRWISHTKEGENK